MDYQSMGNIFKGLAASGSWGCFDEFNRLMPEVLSVCSVQFKTIIDAIRGQKKTFTLMGSTLALDPTCGVFITMNPGYLGRSELPGASFCLFCCFSFCVCFSLFVCFSPQSIQHIGVPGTLKSSSTLLWWCLIEDV